MKNLLAAIIARYDGDATLAASPLWYDSAEENSVPPYCVMYSIGGRNLMLNYGSTYLEPIEIQFSFIDTDDDNPLALQDALHTRFHRQPLTLASGNLVAATRVTGPVLLSSKAIVNGESKTVFHAASRYLFVLQK